MDYIEYYYKHIQEFLCIKGHNIYTITPESFVRRWVAGEYKPVICCTDFCKKISFDGDKEELYMLCCYILSVIDECRFVKLRPTAKEVNDELDKLGGVTSVTFTNKEGQSITVNTENIVKKVVDKVRDDKNDTVYETDKICKLNEAANSTYIQCMFAVELSIFINNYFPIKRKKDSLVSTDEQKLIMNILYLFKLAPSVGTNNRFRQLLMFHDSFKPNIHWSDLPIDGERRLLPMTFVKWKQSNAGNWLNVEYEKLKEYDTVTIKGL